MDQPTLEPDSSIPGACTHVVGTDGGCVRCGEVFSAQTSWNDLGVGRWSVAVWVPAPDQDVLDDWHADHDVDVDALVGASL